MDLGTIGYYISYHKKKLHARRHVARGLSELLTKRVNANETVSALAQGVSNEYVFMCLQVDHLSVAESKVLRYYYSISTDVSRFELLFMMVTFCRVLFFEDGGFQPIHLPV